MLDIGDRLTGRDDAQALVACGEFSQKSCKAFIL
jgi:hypothetical protein